MAREQRKLAAILAADVVGRLRELYACRIMPDHAAMP